MFTGLVQGVGRIVEVEHGAGSSNDVGVSLTVDGRDVPGFKVSVGDSVAIAGACMTAIRVDGQVFSVDTSKESLACTTGLDRPGEVNLETSLRVGDTLGGHLLAGHVDGVGEVIAMSPVHDSWELVVRVPSALAKYFATKGSVAINGVSLTVNRVGDTASGCEFSVNVIPHTYRVTTLRSLHAGDRVNIEVDLIARYVERVLSLSPRSA
ncbi:MAG: riboflavin synthase [Burkholderiaceae bacterium]|nr:riboflavin synthase [Burkholderiaceae bacterium]